jgi:hypothetical protein
LNLSRAGDEGKYSRRLALGRAVFWHGRIRDEDSRRSGVLCHGNPWFYGPTTFRIAGGPCG